MAAELRAERNRSERLQGSVSVLLRSVDDATADGDCWRAQCSAMSRTLGELVAAQSSLQPVAAQTMIDSRTGLSDKTDVVALALSLHPDYTTLSKGSDRQMCKMRGSHFHGDVLNKDVASDARNAAFNAKNESAVRPIETWIKGKNLSRGVSLLTGALEDTSASMVSGRDGDRRRGAIKMKNNWRDMHSTTAKSSNTIHGDITTFNNSTTAEFSTPGKVAVTARDFNRTPGSPFFPDGLSPIMFRWK